MSPLRFVEFCESVLAVRMEPAQRVFWSVAADRVQPCELTGDDRELGRAMFGAVETIPDEARRLVATIKGAGIGFSFFLGYRLLHRALTATELGAAGEIRPALVVAPDMRTARIPVRYALGAADAVPQIKRLIEQRGADGFTIRREAGRFTSVEALPASVGGSALRGRRYIEAGFDESCFLRDQNYQVNDVDCRRAVLPRCVGTFWYGSTPWLETSDVWKTFITNWEAPTSALAARMPTLLVRTDPAVVQLVHSERERDPDGAATEYDCQPPAGGGGFYFDGASVEQCASDSLPLLLAGPHRDFNIGAGFDPAFQRDACAGVIVRKKDGIFEVCEVFERRPERGSPLVPSATVKEFAAASKRHGARRVASDVHYRESVKEHLRESGLSFADMPGGNAGKADVYNFARDLIHAGRVRWSAQHRRLTQQLREIVAKPLPGGLIAITSPRRKGSHGDIASAFCLALWSAEKHNFEYRRIQVARW